MAVACISSTLKNFAKCAIINIVTGANIVTGELVSVRYLYGQVCF